MNILWITNITFPEAESLISGNHPLKSSGGWLLASAETLSNMPEVKLWVASISRGVKTLTRVKGEKIVYYLLPYGKGNHSVNHDYEQYWRIIKEETQPDVVHLHGTEFSHGLAYIEACGSNNLCVSIQGLVSACSKYYFGGLEKKETIHSATFHSIFWGGIKKEYKDLKRRAVAEEMIISKACNIIGRTSWDAARVWSINPNVNYHCCNETLRSEFYHGQTWDYDKCVPHSIFISQASYPYKGFHMILKALSLVTQFYPDVELRIAGNNITQIGTFRQRLLLSEYGNIVRRIIKKNHLEQNIFFTGPLDADGMKNEYLRANVFVCPSSIENSPNSLGEAQILGVPVLASYVGGVSDMMVGNEDCCYRFEEVEMLAYKLIQLFEKKDKINTETMRRKALLRHDPKQNIEVLMSIYNLIKK